MNLKATHKRKLAPQCHLVTTWGTPVLSKTGGPRVDKSGQPTLQSPSTTHTHTGKNNKDRTVLIPLVRTVVLETILSQFSHLKKQKTNKHHHPPWHSSVKMVTRQSSTPGIWRPVSLQSKILDKDWERSRVRHHSSEVMCPNKSSETSSSYQEDRQRWLSN